MSDSARTRLASLGVLLVVFAAGGILGAAFDRTLFADPADDVATVERDDRDGDDDRRDDGERRRRQAMWERAGPTDSQRVVIDSIIGDFRVRMEALQDEFSAMYNPRYWAIVDSTRSSIREVFDDEQRQRYDSITARYDRRQRDGDDDAIRRPSDDSGRRDSGATPSGSDPSGSDAPSEARDGQGGMDRETPQTSSDAPTELRPDDVWMDRWVEDARREGPRELRLDGGNG